MNVEGGVIQHFYMQLGLNITGGVLVNQRMTQNMGCET